MAGKNINALLLTAFANANPSFSEKLSGGSVSSISKVDGSENYTGVIQDASGNTISSDATWKPGSVKGVLGLDSSISIVEQESAGTTAGIFKKADGSLYIVLHKSDTLAELNTLLGYEFGEDQAVIDADKAQVEFVTHLFTENVALVQIDDAFVNHVDLPTE